jgi:hypothetical protein
MSQYVYVREKEIEMERDGEMEREKQIVRNMKTAQFFMIRNESP